MSHQLVTSLPTWPAELASTLARKIYQCIDKYESATHWTSSSFLWRDTECSPFLLAVNQVFSKSNQSKLTGFFFLYSASHKQVWWSVEATAAAHAQAWGVAETADIPAWHRRRGGEGMRRYLTFILRSLLTILYSCHANFCMLNTSSQCDCAC